jgi:hypothetical protein
MHIALMRVAVILVAIALGAASASASVGGNAATEAFWKCPSEFTFETLGSAVHCKKPAFIDRKPLSGCPIGLYPATDRIGNKDVCAATNPVSGEISIERGCKPTDVVLGYTKRIVAGIDFCGKPIAAEIQPPTVSVNLST